MEMLPWDCWGAMPKPDEPMDNGQLASFDRLAALTLDPDRNLAELRAAYAGDAGLRVSTAVFNARTLRTETI